jgi:hypothetical protein
VSSPFRDAKVNKRSFAVKRIALREICSIKRKDGRNTAIVACGFRYNRPKGVQFEDVLFWIGRIDVVELAWLLCRAGKDRAATRPHVWIVSGAWRGWLPLTDLWTDVIFKLLILLEIFGCVGFASQSFNKNYKVLLLGGGRAWPQPSSFRLHRAFADR